VHDCTLYLRHRSTATVTRNAPNMVSPKRCVPKETIHYPDRKLLRYLDSFLQNENTYRSYDSQEIKYSSDVIFLHFLHQTQTVSYLTIRPIRKVRFRSTHKHSYHHIKENVYLCEIQETYVSLNQDVCTYSDLDCIDFNCNQHTNRTLSKFFRG
jgi:hypothetical protein